jgi:murein DD-endopeptidase MepM/ murein hydrolase activator NlpD
VTAESALDAAESGHSRRRRGSSSSAPSSRLPPLTPSILPVPESASVAIGEFGWRVSRITGRTEFSAGIDFAAPRGRPVVAAADGVVRWAALLSSRDSGPYPGYGRIVAIRHGEYVTLYGNLDAVAVARGRRIRRGDRVGTVGESPWYGARALRGVAAEDAAPIDPRLAILGDRSDAALEEIRRSSRPVRRAEAQLPDEFR